MATPPEPDMRTEAAAEADLPAILELTHAAYAQNVVLGFRFSGASEAMESLRESWRKERVYKLVLGGRIVGSVRLVDLPRKVLEVKRLCVHPEFQKRGLGKRLLRFAEEEARRRGCERVRLDTAKPFHALVDWYRRQGYSIVGEMRFPTVDYDSVLLEKRLDP